MICEKVFSSNFSTDTSRYWSPLSQRYAGGDALLTCLHNGWDVQGTVYYEEFWQGGSRRMYIFHFGLMHDGQRVTMRVIDNPFVERLIRELELTLLPADVPRTHMRRTRRMVKQIH